MEACLPAATMALLEAAYERHHHEGFLASDPMQFPARYRHDALACELVAFITACLSYGSRPVIIRTLRTLFEDRLDGDPLGVLLQESPKALAARLSGFYYRFQRNEDILWFLLVLQRILQEKGSLQAVFAEALALHPQRDMKAVLGQAATTLLTLPNLEAHTYGQRYLLPHPNEGSACKRWWLFLRWMVRNDGLDFGHWQPLLSPAELLMPMDTHVFRQATLAGLLQRRTPDWRAAEALTATLRRVDASDPLRFDFAFMGLGMEAAALP